MNDVTSGPQAANGTQSAEIVSRLNWLRAGVMGANDGIVSTAGMVIGVASAAVSDAALMAAGIAALAAGALSMAVAEYVSVSSQRDSQRAALEHQKAELASKPEHRLKELTTLIEARGIDGGLAQQVALQLTESNALAAHARLELGFDPNELSNPWHAGFASMIAFIIGGFIPLLAILLSPRMIAIPVTAGAVVMALAITGSVSAHLGRASKLQASARIVIGGLLAMAITYGIGALVAEHH